MSAPSIAAVQQLVAAHRPRISSEGYPAHVRTAVVAAARARLAEGWTNTRVGRELGLAATTVRQWLRAPPSGSSFRPVTITSDLALPTRPAALSLVTPSGYRLEGLDLDGAAALLARLG